MARGVIWLEEEDKLLVDTTLNAVKRGLSLDESLGLAAKKLSGRSLSACISRWYTKFFEMYNKEVEISRAIVKKSYDNYGRWSFSEEERFTNLMIQQLSEGVLITQALEFCAKEIKRPKSSCADRWYKNILKKNRLSIENEINKRKEKMKVENKEMKVEKNKQFTKSADRLNEKQLSNWTEEKRYELFKIIKTGEITERDIEELFVLSSVTIGRPVYECKIMWQNYISGDEEMNNKFMLQCDLSRAQAEEETIGSNETIQDEQVQSGLDPEVPKEEVQEDLLTLIGNLVNKVERLEKENEELKIQLLEARTSNTNGTKHREVLKIMEEAKEKLIKLGIY